MDSNPEQQKKKKNFILEKITMKESDQEPTEKMYEYLRIKTVQRMDP